MTGVLTAVPDGPMRDRVAAAGLRAALLESADGDATRGWWEAVGRGFQNPQGSDAAFAEAAPSFASRRNVGIWDDTAAEPGTPVATVASWVAPMTMPGGGSIDTWAISAVTVAPTHRRRGLARAMLEGELRTAADAGIPLAILTVSESTLYGRYGFGAASWNADLTIDARRAGWVGRESSGRVQFVSRDRLIDDGPPIAERARTRHPGTILAAGRLAFDAFGRESDEGDMKARRFVRYDDADGAPQGYAVYRVTPNEEVITDGTVDVIALIAATDDAASALWRFVLSFDLVRMVRAIDRPVDDPVRWLVADQRAISTTAVRDQLWVRVLDVRAALTARRWGGPGAVDLEVSDPLGHAAGRWRLDVAVDGGATVEAGGAGDVVLGVDALGSLLLGGASAGALAAAGRLGGNPDSIRTLDRLARTARAPWLGFWF